MSWRAPAIVAGRLSRSLLALVLATAIVSFAFLGLHAAGASAAFSTEVNCALPGSNFQGGDGNQNTPTLEEQTFCNTELLPTTRDWQDLTNVTNLPDPQALDNIFAGGNKETAPGNWGFTTHAGGATPPKDNIISAWSSIDLQPANTFLYLAFEREASTGDTFLTFELNKVKGLWENENKTMIPCRTTGDVLISYNVPGSGEVHVVIYRWVTDTGTKVPTLPGEPECAKTGHFEPASGTPVGSPLSQGNMNFTEEITNFLTDTANPTPAKFAAGKFGEAAINLTKIFENAELGPCFSFGQMSMSSRSSESIESALQDFVSPVPLQANSCSISGRKFNDANGSGKDEPGKPGLEGWTIQLLNEAEEVLEETKTGSGGSYSFTDVAPGSYIVREIVKAGWTCDFPGTGASCEHKVTVSESEINSTGNDFGNVPTTTVTTEQEPTTGVVGTKFGDSASVSGPGTPTPTGDVEFKLYSDNHCGTLVAGPISVPLSGGSAEIPEVDKVTPAPGKYWWVASYAGDSNNAAGKSECSAEPIEVTKAKPTIETSATPSVTVGANIKDTATLNGLVSATGAGKVTFHLYSNDTCTTQVHEFTNPVGVSGSGTVIVASDEFTTTAAGTYVWIAEYEGDANNEPAKTKCGDEGESSVVEKAVPAIKTAATPSATVGDKIKDTATLTGLVDATGQGTVTFKLFANEKCEGTPLHEFENPTGVSGSGTVMVNSDEFTTTAAGTYFWIAEYEGDANNQAAPTKCKDAGETSVVEKAQPQITTSPTSGVIVGANIKDTATLSGLVAPTGTGTVTFKLYSDSQCKSEVFSSTSGGISANGTLSSGEFTTTEAGTYYWIATYSGDASNKPVANSCGDEASVVAKATPSIVTTQQPASGTLGATFKDGATIGGLAGAKPGGSVTWKLYSNSKCEGLVASDGPAAVNANGAYVTPSGAAPKAAGTYYWVATYSGDANNNGVSSACAAEPVAVNPPIEPIVPGTASAHGPSECVVSNAGVFVTGRQIKSVTFYLDGHKLKTVTRTDNKGRYLVNINTRTLRSGVHRVKMVVVFVPSSKTKSKTLNLVVARCRPPRPVFTG